MRYSKCFDYFGIQYLLPNEVGNNMQSIVQLSIVSGMCRIFSHHGIKDAICNMIELTAMFHHSATYAVNGRRSDTSWRVHTP